MKTSEIIKARRESKKYFDLPQWPELEKKNSNTDVAAATARRERVKVWLQEKIAKATGLDKRIAKQQLEVLSRLIYAETILEMKNAMYDLSLTALECELDWKKPARAWTYGDEKFGDKWSINHR